jgi:hypothetical protein
MRGAAGWISGYVVPVMSGDLEGSLKIGTETVDFSGATGYHDHNWGFWDGVRWRWGQVEGGGLAFVYGRVYPPNDAGDAGRLPGFLVAIGEQGPVGYATDVDIDETDHTGTQPSRIVIRARSESLALELDVGVNQVTSTRMPIGSFGGGMNFLQLRGIYRVSGKVAGRAVDFAAAGSAETFR